MLDFSPQLKWSFIQDLDHVRMSSCLLFQSWWAGIVSVTRVERTFPQPYGACSLWLPCNRLSVHVSALRTQCPWTAEHVGPNLQGLGLQLQVQCVWKPIWALYSLKYLFCNFFFNARAVPEKGSRVISEPRGGMLSSSVSCDDPSVVPSTVP